MQNQKVLGIDIGGTNIAFSLVDQHGELTYENCIKTSSIKDGKELSKVVSNQISTKEISAIGIGAPGSNFFTGKIENAPNLNWGTNVPLKHYFESEFKVKTVLTNDANAAAVGEQVFGVAKGMTDFVVITLGTGLGAGVVINNELVYGKYGTAGEYGHVIVEEKGRYCGCGRHGCLETYCSTTGFLRSVKELVNEDKQHSLIRLNTNYTAERIFDLAANGDTFCTYVIEYTAQKLGLALANFAAFSNPEAFILFGGIAQNGNYFKSRVEEYMNNNLLNLYQGKVKILTSSLHNKNAAILGAAAIAFKEIL